MKYRKAKEIIDQVADDLNSYDAQGLIDPSHLYKILRRCNESLGHKINPSKQTVVHVKNYRSVLPDDFVELNLAFMCTKQTVNVTPPKGFQIEYRTTCLGQKSCNPCLTECNNEFVIYQLLDENWTQFVNLSTVAINQRSVSKCNSQCPNMWVNSDKMIDIAEDGTITTTFQNGELYLNYVGSMEDADEDLLVIDDALIEPYYEHELTKYILKWALYNKTADVAELYRDAKIEASRAKIDAMHYVNTPGYAEMNELWKSQRTELYNKYFRPILGY